MTSKVSLNPNSWSVRKIAVVGPGIVGMPMAALLANAKISQGTDHPARVVVIQRNSPTSGWKVDAINSGDSVIGGIEPGLEQIVSEAVKERLLCASHDYSELSDADVILVCVQTDKNGFGPDYGPMFEALTDIATVLKNKSAEKVPLIIFESTLAPTSMNTLVKNHFASHGLEEGRDILLGNSPNRVMPGRLVERVSDSDKVIGGLSPITSQLINKLYSNIVTRGKLHLTNCLTAEIVKTLENAYRDVRIAYAAEIARYCDRHDIDFYQVRDYVNDRLAKNDNASADSNAVPSGGLLIPTIGVGGHCLPKDGILLLWRMIESQVDMSSSLILESRRINDESPIETIRLGEKLYGDIAGKSIALMGVAYRFNSEDTRNSPTLLLARLLLDKRCKVILHDPYVKPDDQKLIKFNLQEHFTRDIDLAAKSADLLIFCTAHKTYSDNRDRFADYASKFQGIIDGCNLFTKSEASEFSSGYAGIGKGKASPSNDFLDFIYEGFRIIEIGIANEVKAFIDFANNRYSSDIYNKVDFGEVQRIARTCATGCDIVEPGPIEAVPVYNGFSSRLVRCAHTAYFSEKPL